MSFALSTRCIAKVDSTKPQNPCGEFAMQIRADGKDLCMMKFNAGDDAFNYFTSLGETELANEAKILALPTTIKATPAGSSCSPSSSNKCCWYGQTVTSCDSANGGYSGCNRTVCDWRAANEYCSKLTYLGKTWRLATGNELASLGTQLNTVSLGQGINGLMLCDSAAGYSSARCYHSDNIRCASSGTCYPYSLWSSNTTGEKAYDYPLGTGSIYVPHTNSFSLALSVRCVSDL